MKNMTPVLRSWAARTISGSALKESQIIAQATQWKPLCGIYFLIHEGRIKYIGQGLRVEVRLAEHHRSGKQFDSVAILECNPDQLDVIESFYIHQIQPEWNGRRSNGVITAPIDFNELYKNRRKEHATGLTA